MSAIIGFMWFMALFWFVTAVGVGYDAHKHGGDGLRWFGITLVLGIFGLIWYSSETSNAARHARRSPKTERYRVYGPVRDAATQEETEVEMTITADSRETAVTRFKAECSDSRYLPLDNPTVEVKKSRD